MALPLPPAGAAARVAAIVCLAALTPAVLLAAYVLSCALLAIGFILGFVPLWAVRWWPAW